MKKIQVAVMAGLISFFAVDGIAGEVQPVPLEVDLVNMFALGDQATARFSDNDVEHIGCGIRTIDDGVNPFFEWGFCQANDATGEFIACFTENPDLIRAIYAISDFSFITFKWQDDGIGGAECTQIGSSNQSFYIPGFFKLQN